MWLHESGPPRFNLDRSGDGARAVVGYAAALLARVGELHLDIDVVGALLGAFGDFDGDGHRTRLVLGDRANCALPGGYRQRAVGLGLDAHVSGGRDDLPHSEGPRVSEPSFETVNSTSFVLPGVTNPSGALASSVGSTPGRSSGRACVVAREDQVIVSTLERVTDRTPALRLNEDPASIREINPVRLVPPSDPRYIKAARIYRWNTTFLGLK